MTKNILLLAAVSGVLAVITGAFGAHGLKAKLGPDEMKVWHTAVEYQFYHTLALLFVAVLSRQPLNLYAYSAWAFGLGILLFSGSLYLLSTKSLHQLPVSVLGPVTPIGGLFFIIGWVCLFIAAFKN